MYNIFNSISAVKTIIFAVKSNHRYLIMRNSSHKNGDKVTVRESYYTFSKTYPRKTIERRGVKKQNDGRKRMLKASLLVCLAAVIVCGAFFFVFLADGIAKADPSKIEKKSETESVDFFADGELKAYTLSREYIGDRTYIKSFIRRMIRHDATAVVIDFKDSEGRLLYSSNSFIATGNSIYDNDSVRRTVQQFKNKNIAVIAAVTCFRDSFAAEANPEMAVKYSDTDVNWSGDGSYWLNPYSKDAKAYINYIIDEIKDFGVDGFILSDASFPSAGDIDSASYPGEKSSARRNSVLQSFVNGIKSSGGFTALSIPSKLALDPGADPFYGSAAAVCENIIFDLTDGNEAYIVDKNEDYASALSVFADLIHTEECEAIFCIPASSASNRFIRTLKSAGYKAVIIASDE